MNVLIFQGDGEEDPMRVALPTKNEFQNIRALPLDPGSCAFFSHRIIHWGSTGRKGYPDARISFSFACSDDSFEPSYMSRDCVCFHH